MEDANAEIPTIAFVPTIAAESIGSLPPLTSSCRIQGRSDEDRVTLTHTSSGALLFVDGDGSEVIELLFLNFEGATQVTTTTVGVPAMAEFLVASQVDVLGITSCIFNGGMVDLGSMAIDAAGAVAVVGSSTVRIDSCIVSSCSAASGALAAGALVVEGGLTAVSITATTFLDNSVAAALGPQYGAVFLAGISSVDFTSCRFEQNTAECAALFVESVSLDVIGCLFLGNTATHPLSGGGAILFNGANMRFTCTQAPCGLVSNTAGKGGAIAIEATLAEPSSLLIENLAPSGTVFPISTNSASGGGGAVYGETTDIQLTGRWNVDNNHAGAGSGGAFRCQSFFSDGASSFTDNQMDEGTAEGQGGVVYADSDVIILNAIEFLRNKARSGGGVVFSMNGNVAITDVAGSITDNDANFGDGFGEGGGVICAFNLGASVELTMVGALSGSELRGNSAIPSGGVIFSAGTVAMSVCLGCTDSFPVTLNVCDELGGVVYADGAAVIQLGDTVSVTLNSASAGYGVGGAFFSFSTISVVGGALFSQNCIDCAQGGSIWAELDVIINTQGDMLSHRVDEAGAAIYSFRGNVTIVSMGSLSANEAGMGGAVFTPETLVIGRIDAVNGNIATADGGAFYAKTIVVDQIGSLTACSATNGGVFYAMERADIGLIGGVVRGNTALAAPRPLGSVLFVASSLSCEVSLAPLTTLQDNNGKHEALSFAR